MQITLSFIMFFLIILFFFSNRRNKVNKWCAFAGIFFWLGIFKQVVLEDIIPAIHNSYGDIGLDKDFAPFHSIFTWMIYVLAIPTMTIAGLYFGNIDKTNPKHMRVLKYAIYAPALIITLFFTPWYYREYQLTSLPFWIVHTVYNFSFGILITLLAFRGIRKEGSIQIKKQKKWAAIGLLPPLNYWIITVFIPHLFQVKDLFYLWKNNIFILLISVIIFIIMAFRDGFMGLKLVTQSYNWDTDMQVIDMSAEYNSHFIKTQTTKLEMASDQLKKRLNPHIDETDKELFNIISRSIDSLKNYIVRIRFHSMRDIDLGNKELCSVKNMLVEASSGLPDKIDIDNKITNDISWFCSRVHMTEVFANIIKNAAEAILEIKQTGKIEINGKYRNRYYYLRIKDNGVGIDRYMLKSVFWPHISTKNNDKNYGIGLSYCRRVITEHGGYIDAESETNEGTTFIIKFPSKKTFKENENSYIFNKKRWISKWMKK